MSFIFVSYSRQDQDYVGQLVQALKAQELPVWLDDRIDYGTTWSRVLEKHLNECQVFLLVMTPRSHESHWVQCELARAIELKKPIFPLLLEGTRWFELENIQVVDVTNGRLPPSKFFDTVRQHFPKAPVISQTIPITDAAKEPIPIPVLPPPTRTKSAAKPAKPVDDDLSSEKGINYTGLQNLLKAGNWKEADQETANQMLKVMKKEGWFQVSSKDLLNFPCVDLKTIDRLWVKYSSGQFGFSVQKEIYVQCGAKLNGKYPGDKIWQEFCDLIGWKVNGSYIYCSDVIFSTSAPQGHLPKWRVTAELLRDETGSLRDMTELLRDPAYLGRGCRNLFSRIQTCRV